MKRVIILICMLMAGINISAYGGNGQWRVNKTLSYDEAKNGAEKGDPYCMAVYSIYKELGWKNSKQFEVGTIDLEESLKYAKESALKGNPLGEYQLGNLLYNNNQNNEDALKLLQSSYRQLSRWYDDPYANTAVGKMLYEGKVLAQDYNESWKLLLRASEHGDSEAAYLLATLKWSNDLVLPNDMRNTCIILAANDGFKDAVFTSKKDLNPNWDEIGFKGAWSLQYAYADLSRKLNENDKVQLKESQKKWFNNVIINAPHSEADRNIYLNKAINSRWKELEGIIYKYQGGDEAIIKYCSNSVVSFDKSNYEEGCFYLQKIQNALFALENSFIITKKDLLNNVYLATGNAFIKKGNFDNRGFEDSFYPGDAKSDFESAIGNFLKSYSQTKAENLTNIETAAALDGLVKYKLQGGRYGDAITDAKQSLKIREAAYGDTNTLTAISLEELGDVYSSLGGGKKALPLYKKAYDIRTKVSGNDDIDSVRVTYKLADLYYITGDYSNGLPLAQGALEALKKQSSTNNQYVADSLLLIGKFYEALNNNVNSKKYYNDALVSFNAIQSSDPKKEISNLKSIAILYLKDRKYNEAIAKLQDCLLLSNKQLVQHHPEVTNILYYLALSFSLNEQIDQARETTLRWQDEVNYWLKDILTFGETRRLDWASQNLSMSLPAYALTPDQNAKLIFRWKGIVLDSLLEDSKSIDKSYNGEKVSVTLAKIRKLKDQLAELETASESKTGAQQDSIQMQIESLESQVGKRFKEMVRSSEWSTHDELKSSLNDNDVLLEVVRYNNLFNNHPCYGIAITPRKNEPRWISLDNANSIDAAIASYRKAISMGDEAALKDQIRFLSENLWKPIAAVLPPETKRMYIGADGPLNFLSFATLLDERGNFLSEDYQIAYVGTGRDLMRPAKPLDKKSFVIYANPVFASEDIPKNASSPTNVALSFGTRAVELAEFAKVQLPQLPGTELEASTVSQIAKDAQWYEETHLGADASKKGLLAMQAPAILHLATHGFFLGGEVTGGEGERGMKIASVPDPSSAGAPKALKGISPMRQSGVALTGGQSTLQAWGRGEFPDPSNDGILTAEEVAGLDLNGTWLVTLSACETGVGQVQSGEGVFGLRRAFMMAGAQNLLMTLWPVSDEVTPKIMADFYKKALATRDAAGSLSDVQRDWLVKLRNEKGLLAAVRDAGPFAIAVMANQSNKQSFLSNNSSADTTSVGDEQSEIAECIKKTKIIMDQNNSVNSPKFLELCTQRFKELLHKGFHTSKDDPMGFFDCDVRYDTQDGMPRIVEMGPGIKKSGNILVPVKLQFQYGNLTFTKTWVYVYEAGQWRADDMQTQKAGQSNATSLADDLTKYKPAGGYQPANAMPNSSAIAVSVQGSASVMEFADALAKADAGDAYAQGVVSIYYTMGYKVPKDTAKGLTYALKSAAQKNPLGIYQVGVLRVLGVGMKKDKAQGRKLISEAFDGLNAMSGDPYALYDLGLMALEGVGVDQNPKEAARLFKASADMGYAPAQRMFAKFLEAGVGVRKDLEAARQYQSQSSAQWSVQ